MQSTTRGGGGGGVRAARSVAADCRRNAWTRYHCVQRVPTVYVLNDYNQLFSDLISDGCIIKLDGVNTVNVNNLDCTCSAAMRKPGCYRQFLGPHFSNS